MSEKPEALEVAAALRERIAKAPSWDSTRTLLVCDDAARCIEKLHAEIERLHDELRQSSIDTTRAEIERLREALREIADETYDAWTNGAKAQRIAESALKEDKT